MTDWRDVVARLRDAAAAIARPARWVGYDAAMCREAAALIEAQAAEVERLREALDQILDDMGTDGLSVCEDTKTQARAALAAGKADG